VSEISFGRAGTGFAVGHARVAAVGFHAQEVFLHESVQHFGAQRKFYAAKPVHLIYRQPESRHFEKLGAETLKRLLHDDLARVDAVG
jgi:hypothetical protein